MSYDLWVEMDAGGPEPIMVGDWNYTSNCAPMWAAAGADLAAFDHERAGDCTPILAGALIELRSRPDHYRAMNPPNGWGSYDTLVPALVELHELFIAYPDATVRVSR